MPYSVNDFRSYQKKNGEDSLEHSWGTSPEQKARERQYNHDYWERNRERIMEARANARRRLGFDAREARDDAARRNEQATDTYEYRNRQERNAINAHRRMEDVYDDHSLSTEQTRETFRNVETAAEYTRDAAVRMREAGMAYREAERAYSQTPLGKIENAARDAADAVNDAIESVKNFTISAISNLRKR